MNILIVVLKTEGFAFIETAYRWQTGSQNDISLNVVPSKIRTNLIYGGLGDISIHTTFAVFTATVFCEASKKIK